MKDTDFSKFIIPMLMLSVTLLLFVGYLAESITTKSKKERLSKEKASSLAGEES